MNTILDAFGLVSRTRPTANLERGLRLLLCGSLLLAGAGTTPNLFAADATETQLTFDFEDGEQGWLPFFADLPPDSEEFYELEAGIRLLPPSLEAGGATKGFMLRGNNHSDDLQMGLVRSIGRSEGIIPGMTYEIEYKVVFASEAQSGCAGIGGSPGESVVLKVGATPFEPRVELDPSFAQPYLVLNADAGSQIFGGLAASVSGPIANGIPCGERPFGTFTLVHHRHRHPVPVTADEQGRLWLLVLTDSGNEGVTELYLRTIEIRLAPLSGIEPGRLVNLSSRGPVSPGRPMIGGLVLQGAGERPILVRAVGPGLTRLGVSDVLADPRLELVAHSGSIIAANDDWHSSPEADAVEAAGRRVGAFDLNRPSRDAAVLTSLPAGLYTVIVTGGEVQAPGTVLLEIYDATPEASSQPNLINLSTRLHADWTLPPPILGFVTAGSPAGFLLRATGPSLKQLGVVDSSPGPFYTRLRTDSKLLSHRGIIGPFSGEFPRISDAEMRTGAFARIPGNNEVAFAPELMPGVFTLDVDSQAEGTMLLEIYRVPE